MGLRGGMKAVGLPTGKGQQRAETNCHRNASRFDAMGITGVHMNMEGHGN
jgi:hypothetical protein